MTKLVILPTFDKNTQPTYHLKSEYPQTNFSEFNEKRDYDFEEKNSSENYSQITIITSYTVSVDSYDEFKQKIEDGGFILAHWDGTAETEELIKNETKATIRCIPLEGDKTPGVCMVTGKPSAQRVVFARAY